MLENIQILKEIQIDLILIAELIETKKRTIVMNEIGSIEVTETEKEIEIELVDLRGEAITVVDKIAEVKVEIEKEVEEIRIHLEVMTGVEDVLLQSEQLALKMMAKVTKVYEK